jgi:acylphosphatase
MENMTVDKESACKRYSIRVKGRVQGVGFRHFAREHARLLGLTGRARNEPDRTVSVKVQGPLDKLEAYVRLLRCGPLLGFVSDVEFSEIPCLEDETDFIVMF